MSNLERYSGEWHSIQLGEIGVITGAGVDKKVNSNEVPVRLVNYLDVYNKTFLYSVDLTHVVSTKPEKAHQCNVKKGDVFFTPSSEVPDDIGSSAVSMEGISDGVYSYHVVRLRLKENWDIRFRGYVFQTKEFLDEASRQCEGSGTRYVISLPKFRAMTVRFPPSLEEQRSIAEVLSDVDGLIKALDALIDKKRAIKKATMQQLLTGKTRLPGFSGDWETKHLGEIGEISGAGVDKKVNSNDLPVRLVNYLDVYNKTTIYSKDLTHEVTARTDQIRRCAVERGDIFFTPSSEVPDDIACSAVAMEDISDGVYSYHVVRLRLKIEWNIDFRAYIFNTNEFLNQASRQCEGSGTRYVISLPKFRAMTVRFPPTIEEQRTIATVLSDMDAEITAFEQRRDKTIAIKQGMMQQLLTGKVRLLKSE